MEKGSIITLSGPSGVGKTTIAGELLQANSEWELLISLTTRGPRPSDLPGEYEYNVSNRRFDELEREGKFVWTVPVHRNKYGTLSRLIDGAFDPQNCEACASSQTSLEHVSIMLPTPQVIPILLEYAQGRGQVTPFFVTAEREILRARLEKRGEKEEDVNRRLADCDKWAKEARESGLPYVFIDNNGAIEKAVEQVLENLVGSS